MRNMSKYRNIDLITPVAIKIDLNVFTNVIKNAFKTYGKLKENRLL